MRLYTMCAAAALIVASSTANAAVFNFSTDPFAGSDALTTPGRQVVGGEPFIDFSIASDVFAFLPSAFGLSVPLSFANALAGNLPTDGVNVVVLQSLDNDANPATPFGAGNAANLIADRITTPGGGFFVYFNSGLDLPRLVFSTDLSANTADLKILARLVNLADDPDVLPSFTESNFTVVPEPSGALLLALGGAALVGGLGLRRRRASGASA